MSAKRTPEADHNQHLFGSINDPSQVLKTPEKHFPRLPTQKHDLCSERNINHFFVLKKQTASLGFLMAFSIILLENICVQEEFFIFVESIFMRRKFENSISSVFMPQTTGTQFTFWSIALLNLFCMTLSIRFCYSKFCISYYSILIFVFVFQNLMKKHEVLICQNNINSFFFVKFHDTCAFMTC